jgi:transcriptional regulator with XRE-family HTH domain
MVKNRSSSKVSGLDEYLTSRGMTSADLARLAGVSQTSIGRWKGSTSPRLDVAVRASAALGISLKQFVMLLNLDDCPIDRVPDDSPDRDRVDEFAQEIMEVVNRYSR